MSASSDLVEALAGPVLDVAPRLLGWVIQHGGVSVRLTEVEAYAGPDDPASHAFRGVTPRNAVMFGPPGRLYCYLSHGVHVCANVCTGPEGQASAVLLRAGEVVEGVARARERSPRLSERDLARGPGRLGRALGVDLLHNGAPLLGEAEPRIAPGPPPRRTATGPRVGVRLAPDRPWRFWDPDSPTVSAYRRNPRAAPPGSPE